MAKFGYQTVKMHFSEGDYSEALQRNRQNYKSPDEITEFLDKWGAEGWELCAVIGTYAYIFKKRLE